ncbi:hypothetical protein D3C71_1368780 [compost metagenome]
MAGEGVDVLDHLGLAVARRRAADAAPERNAQAAQRPLIGADHQFLRLGLVHDVEAGPEEGGKGVSQHGGHGRHPGRPVRLAVQHGQNLGLDLGVAFSLVGGAVVAGDVGHGGSPSGDRHIGSSRAAQRTKRAVASLMSGAPVAVIMCRVRREPSL